ncbi:MAG TPA: arabinogalactan endo-1,4-beta-galactosidase [Polyangiaceae bacterium]
MLRTRTLAAVSLVFCCSCSGADGGGTEIALDEERAELVPVVVNGSFEDDNNGVASPVGWTSSGSVNADFTEWGGSAGNWRLSHWSPDAYSVDTKQTITGLSDGTYTVRVQARRSTGNNNAYVDFDCGRDSGRVYVPVSWPSQWLEIVASARVKHGTCTIALHTDGAAGEWTNFDNVRLERGEPRLSVLGADVSSLDKSEDFGGKYYYEHEHRRHSHKKRGDALDILEDHGASHVRLRVWVNPADGYHDRDEMRRMARRAHEQDLKVLVDLHYSDTWADPAHQTKPAAWASFTTEQLRQAVYQHTYGVCRAATVNGKGPDMIQLGNELNAGMLWPDGHTWDPPNWDNLAGFLKAGYDAVKACSPRTKVALHLANGGDNGLYRWWFDNITSRGVEFDIIAASFYNYWHGGMGDLQWNLNDVSARYDKDVMVVETAYPFTLDFDDAQANIIGLESDLVAGYPATPEGQARNFRDVMSIVRAVPNGRGLGVFYWDATWIAVPGNGWDPTDPASGDTWENQALFDFDGRALPAMEEFKP